MKPILFNTDMVRAILDGRKTVTRRVVKPQPVCYGPNIAYPKHEAEFFLDTNCGWLRCSSCGNAPQYSREGAEVCHFWKPPCYPDDILYVRETWKQAVCDPAGGGYALTDLFLYKADEPINTDGMLVEEKWHPPIHMPREAARIFLRVTDVRVDRLQDMNMNDIQSEGVVPDGVKGGQWQQWQHDYMKPAWDSTIKPKDRALYGWEANPWVWVVEFEKISKEMAENEA